MSAVYRLLVVLGSLGVFLFGMRLMTEGLQQVAGVFSGFATTAVIQSSSATTVMTVGFVDAGLLMLRQAIGVVMGANIGTTITGWLVALLGFKFSVTSIALPAVALGMAFLLVKRVQ